MLIRVSNQNSGPGECQGFARLKKADFAKDHKTRLETYKKDLTSLLQLRARKTGLEGNVVSSPSLTLTLTLTITITITLSFTLCLTLSLTLCLTPTLSMEKKKCM